VNCIFSKFSWKSRRFFHSFNYNFPLIFPKISCARFFINPRFDQIFQVVSPVFLCRRNLGSAIDHASGALAADAGASSSVKALYRRGLARRRLAEHQNEQQNLQLAQVPKQMGRCLPI
jgi:hypothetical protein